MSIFFKPNGRFLENMLGFQIVREGRSKTTTAIGPQTVAAGAFIRERNESTQAEIYHEHIGVPDYPWI